MSIVRSLARKGSVAVVSAIVIASHAMAAVPAEIDTLTDDVETVFSTVKTIVVGVVAFGVIIGFVKMLRKK